MGDLVSQARAALHRLEDAKPLLSSREITTELDGRWTRGRLAVGIAGPDIRARSELLNFLCGERLLDPTGRRDGCARVRLRRGGTPNFRAVRDDGSEEAHSLGTVRAELHDRVDHARRELAAHQLALQTIDRTRPPWWAVWAWLARLFRGGGGGANREERKRVSAAIADSHHRIAALETQVGRLEADAAVARKHYVETLTELASGARSGTGVRDLFVEVADGPLPDGVEAIELTPMSRSGAAEVDAVVVATSDALFADGSNVRIGGLAETVAALPQLLACARALRVGTRARVILDAAASTLEDHIDHADHEMRREHDRLVALRVDDTARMVASRLDELRPHVASSVHAVIEHGAAHLGLELAQLSDGWFSALKTATSADDLRAVSSRIENEWSAEALRVGNAVRLLVVGGVGGAAHDLYPELVRPLRELGAKLTHEKRPLPAVDVLPSLASSSLAKLGGGWLSGLFRSLDTRRGEIQAKVRDRLAHLHEVASAELLDAEPPLHAAVTAVLSAELAAAIDRHMLTVDAAIQIERERIATARARLAPLARARDDARRDARELAEEMARLKADQPAAAALASL